MMQPEKIIIADDHPLFRRAILATLKPKFPSVIWVESQTIAELETALTEHTESDLLLLDLNIPGANGFNTLIHVRSHFSHIPVVIISAHEDRDTVEKAMSFGATGFIPKSTPVEDISNAINEVLLGNEWLPKTYQENTLKESQQDIADKLSSLTQQQYKILTMFYQGLLNKQIAYELNVSEATIKAHATAIFRKLDVRNRTQAVIAISQLNLTEKSY
jgi:DNA-binding NarL/FixJ family response regulator